MPRRGHARPGPRPRRRARHRERPDRLRQPRRPRDRRRRRARRRQRSGQLRRSRSSRVAEQALRLRRGRRPARRPRALATAEPVGGRDAERDHPPRRRSGLHRLPLGRSPPLRHEAPLQQRAMARPRSRAQARRGDEGVDRGGDSEDRVGRSVGPGDDRHLPRRVRPQHARRERRQGLGEEPRHRRALPAPGRPPRRLRPRHGRVLGRRAEVRDAARTLERARQHGERLARLPTEALRQRRGARSARVGRARLPRAERRGARRRDRGVGHQAPHHDRAPHLARSLDGREGAVFSIRRAPPTIRTASPSSRG